MLRLDERVMEKSLHEFQPLLASEYFIAKRAKGLEFGCEFCFAIHCDGDRGISLTQILSDSRERILPGALKSVYSRCGMVAEDSSAIPRVDPRRRFWSRLPALRGVERARKEMTPCQKCSAF